MKQRALIVPDDLPAAIALADCTPLSLPHCADWPYRFASWALDEPEHAQVWLDDTGRMLGWTALQTPFWAIDCVLHPAAPALLYREMITWATTRARALSAVGAGRPLWFVSIADACLQQQQELAALGFVDVSQATEDPWSKLLFALPEERLVAPVLLPSGMHIRSLRLPEEIDAYVALQREVFESENMRSDWRTRITQMPGYRNELDLVLVSDAAKLYGFCVTWLHMRSSGETIGQIEPLGIQEQQRGHRLSQALVAEAVRRLRAQGAGQIFVETDRQRASAMAAYTAMGFEPAHEVRMYRYNIPEVP